MRVIVWRGLNNSRFLKCFIRAVFGDGFETSCRHRNGHCLVELGYENTLLFEVWLASDLPRWVKFGSTNTVGVAASDLRANIGDGTCLSHKFG